MEHREPRLQYDRERHREALSDERLEDREARLQHDRESHIGKHDLMRGWSTGRLGCNVTERAIERATGSSECREYRCFSNIQFKQRC